MLKRRVPATGDAGGRAAARGGLRRVLWLPVCAALALTALQPRPCAADGALEGFGDFSKSTSDMTGDLLSKATASPIILLGVVLTGAAVGFTVTSVMSSPKHSKYVAVPLRAYSDAAVWLAAGGRTPPPALLGSVLRAIRALAESEHADTRGVSDRALVVQLLEAGGQRPGEPAGRVAGVAVSQGAGLGGR